MAVEPKAEFREVDAVRRGVGVWLRDDYTFVRIAGSDAASWLHAQTTNDIASLESGQGNANAILDRQGRVQCYFTVHRWEDEYWLLVERVQVPILVERLESALFIEDVTIEDTGAELEQVVIQGPATMGYLGRLLDTDEGVGSELLPSAMHGCHPIELLGHEVLAFRATLTGEDGYVFVTERGKGQTLVEELIDHGAAEGVIEIEAAAREVLRVEAGIPRFGVDFDSSCIISETTLERDAVSFEKGCYPGQEVVARLRTYGALKKGLVGLIFDDLDAGVTARLSMDTARLNVDGKKIGELRSVVWSTTLDRTIAMAYLDKEHRTPNTTLELAIDGIDGVHSARVIMLPFYEAPSREERARAQYEEALARFERDSDDTDSSGIPLLKEAILLDPAFEDAYEAIGVILHRQHRVDEAIHFMQRLARLNPNCLMAHTNLSVFYVAKGMIEEAEVEKAKAAVLGIQRASDERKAKEMADAERKRLEHEARERIAMFKEVIEIDPLDSVATFGLGKAYIQLNDYESAVPWLQKAIESQKDYSAAYLTLGKSLEFLGRNAEAIDAFRRGIEAASRKGDLMPLREMERRLRDLQH